MSISKGATMTIKFEKRLAGIKVGSGEVEVSRVVNALTLGWAEREVIRQLKRKGLSVVAKPKLK